MTDLLFDYSPFSKGLGFDKPVYDVSEDYSITADDNILVNVNHPDKIDVMVTNTHASNPFGIRVYGAFGEKPPISSSRWEQFPNNKETTVGKSSSAHIKTTDPYDWVKIAINHTATKNSTATITVRIS